MTSVGHDGAAGSQPVPAHEQIVLRTFVMAVHKALRALRLYPRGNTMVDHALTHLHERTAYTFNVLGHCALHGAGDYLFVNETRLRLQLDNYASIVHLLARFRSAGIGGIILLTVPSTNAWVTLLLAIGQPALDLPAAERAARVTDALARAGVTDFEIITGSDELPDGDGVQIDAAERARQTYIRSLSATRDLLTGVRIGRSPSLKQAKRAVQGIVDSVMADSVSMMGLTTLREFDEYTFVHSVNVCVLAIALGRRVGLNKVQLLDLGLAALLHDIGKSTVPLEILNKRTSLDTHEFAQLQEHTWRGLLTLYHMAGSTSHSWRAMTTAYEHHLRTDLSGYPAHIRPRELSLFSRIVAIVDSFDAATSTRVYKPKPWSPADVLQGMRDNVELGLDPVLVKAFINLTGIFPVGTVVALDTHELGVVHARSDEPSALSRPIVRLLFDERGNRMSNTPIVDLTEQTATGEYRRTIVRTEDPDRYGIRVSDFVA